MPDDSALLEALHTLRERGAIGEQSLAGAVAHAASFVSALPTPCRRVLDLGSGGGLPGLVISVRRPDLSVVLTDRRERRMDLVRRAVSRLGLLDRVEVVTGDVVALGQDACRRAAFDVVTARAFGDSTWTMQCARPFLPIGGFLIVSEPPRLRADGIAERWNDETVRSSGFVVDPDPFDHVRRLIAIEQS